MTNNRVITVLSLGALLVVAQMHITVPLVPEIGGRYDVPTTTAAWVGGGFGLTYAVGNLVFGVLSDRFDRRHVMVVGALGSAVMLVLAGLSPTFGVILAVRLVQGFVAAAFPPVALAYAVEVLPAGRRATGLAAISSSFMLAGIAGQAYALGVDTAAGWRWVFWLLAPALVGIAVATRRLPVPPWSEQPAEFGATLVTLGRLLRRPALLVAYGCAVTLLLTFVGMYTAFNAAVDERYGITGAGPLMLLRLAGLPGIVAALFAGSLVRRHGPHRVGLAAFLVASAGLVVEALAGPLWLLLAGSAIFVAGLAFAVPCAVAVAGAASGEARGAGIAGYGFLVGVGAGAVPLVLHALPDFTALCLGLGAVLAAAAVLIGAGPRPVAAAPLVRVSPAR
jgi:predicted MFS family arabinose efflux permease